MLINQGPVSELMEIVVGLRGVNVAVVSYNSPSD